MPKSFTSISCPTASITCCHFMARQVSLLILLIAALSMQGLNLMALHVLVCLLLISSS